MDLPVRNNTPARVAIDVLQREFKQELQNILDWWAAHMLDEENGGFYSYGTLQPEADKGVMLNAQLLWLYSAAASLTEKMQYRQLAERAYDYFCLHFWDEIEGGVIWTVDFQGNPVDTQKRVNAQAFAIYALSEYYFLTKEPTALDKATEIFWLIERYSLDRQQKGYYNSLTPSWSSMATIHLSEKASNEAEILNIHLHILAAYINFYRVHPYTALQESLENIIGLFLDRFYLSETGSLLLSFDYNLEASWLLWEAAQLLGSEILLERVRPVSTKLVEATLQSNNGSFPYETQNWQSQAEAVVGLWNTYQITGDTKFAEASLYCWQLIKNQLQDKNLDLDKSQLWKSSFYNSRMCLEMVKRLG